MKMKHKMPLKTRNKIRQSMKNIVPRLKTLIQPKTRLSPKTEFKKGDVPWNKGKTWSKKTIRKLRKSHLGVNSGPNHYLWISDRTKLKKSQKRNDSAYYEWRKSVWIRDNYRCALKDENCSNDIVAHHILGWTEYPKLRYDINNGITLCRFHHPMSRKKEKELIVKFQNFIINPPMGVEL